MKPGISLIVNTCNQAEYLDRVLSAVSGQSEAPEEVIVAEDGADKKTRLVFQRWADSGEIRALHATQENQGFHRARILNEAIRRASSDYLVFLDGDSVPHPDFIRDHRALARRGFFVQGHRTFLKQRGSQWFGTSEFHRDRRRALLSGEFERIKSVFRWTRPFVRVLHHVEGVRGCNLGVWHDDLVTVNGYDEEYIGWGCEDWDLATRLLRFGSARRDVRGQALCYHLWHPQADRSHHPANQERLERTMQGDEVRCLRGIDLHEPTEENRTTE